MYFCKKGEVKSLVLCFMQEESYKNIAMNI